MKEIIKGAEPPSLTAHRQAMHSDYNNYADKQVLRDSLVTEQRGICCYCMGRIRSGSNEMKIEHWRSQSGHPAEQLRYRNLLGACCGGQGQPPHLQHCDTRKGDQSLQWNPADPADHIETRIRYEIDGGIRSDDPIFNTQLDDVLNLNMPRLKNNRRAIWDGITEWWKLEKARLHTSVPRQRIQNERNRRVGGNGNLDQYCQVAVWLLDQRLSRIAV